jgi:acyl-CoA reductase-like NAD-dependent aldehyde dehydrogenase
VTVATYRHLIVEERVDAEDGAFGAWSLARPPERQRVFLAAADILERRSDGVVGLLAKETDCTLRVRFSARDYASVRGAPCRSAGASTPLGPPFR